MDFTRTLRTPVSPQALHTIALFGLSALLLGSKLFDALPPQDEGVLLVYPDLILRGYTPYNDFAAMYPPGTYYLIAAAFYVFGNSIFVERLLGVVYQLCIVVSVYLLGSRLNRNTGFLSALTALVVLLCFPCPGAYSMFFAVALTVFALHCAVRTHEADYTASQQLWAATAGLLVGSTFWFRQDVAIIGTLSVTAALCPGIRDRIRGFSVGFALPILSLTTFILRVGPEHVFHSLIVDAIRVAPGRKLPVELSLEIVGLGACTFLNVLFGLRSRATMRPTHYVWLVRSIGILSLGLLPSALQRADFWHLSYVGCVIAALTVISSGIFFVQSGRRSLASQLLWKALIFTALIVFCGAIAQSAPEHRRTGYRLAWGDRSVFAGENLVPGATSWRLHAKNLLAAIGRAASPGEKLFVGPADLRFTNYNETYFYYLLPELEPASRYLEMNPGSANRVDSELASEVMGADWLILSSRFSFLEPNASRVPGSSLPNQIVWRYFCLHSEHGPWRLLYRCDRQAGRANPQYG